MQASRRRNERAVEKLPHGVHALTASRADERDGRAYPLGKSVCVEGAAARPQIVGHIETDQRRYAKT